MPNTKPLKYVHQILILLSSDELARLDRAYKAYLVDSGEPAISRSEYIRRAIFATTLGA